MTSDEARVALLTIGLQESKFLARVQIVNGGGQGPARSFWQFERGGGVRGVLRHPASAKLAREIVVASGVPADEAAVHKAMGLERYDIMSAALARLLLVPAPTRLPAIGDEAGLWDLYARRVWRPGKPHINTWAGNYAMARATVAAAAGGVRK